MGLTNRWSRGPSYKRLPSIYATNQPDRREGIRAHFELKNKLIFFMGKTEEQIAYIVVNRPCRV